MISLIVDDSVAESDFYVMFYLLPKALGQAVSRTGYFWQSPRCRKKESNIKGNGRSIPSDDKEEDNEKQSKKVVGTDFVGGDDGYPVENAGLCGDGK